MKKIGRFSGRSALARHRATRIFQSAVAPFVLSDLQEHRRPRQDGTNEPNPKSCPTISACAARSKLPARIHRTIDGPICRADPYGTVDGNCQRPLAVKMRIKPLASHHSDTRHVNARHSSAHICSVDSAEAKSVPEKFNALAEKIGGNGKHHALVSLATVFGSWIRRSGERIYRQRIRGDDTSVADSDRLGNRHVRFSRS